MAPKKKVDELTFDGMDVEHFEHRLNGPVGHPDLNGPLAYHDTVVVVVTARVETVTYHSNKKGVVMRRHSLAPIDGYVLSPNDEAIVDLMKDLHGVRVEMLDERKGTPSFDSVEGDDE